MTLTRSAKMKANNFLQGTYPGIHALSYLWHSLIQLDSVPDFPDCCGMTQMHVYLVNGIALTPPLSRAILQEGRLSSG